MFNPLKWFSRTPHYSEQQLTEMVDNISLRYGAVNNAGTYTWKDLFGNVHPRELNSDRTQLTLAAIYCAINTYIGAITSLPRFCQKPCLKDLVPLRE
jgi:hypothetical protein